MDTETTFLNEQLAVRFQAWTQKWWLRNGLCYAIYIFISHFVCSSLLSYVAKVSKLLSTLLKSAILLRVLSASRTFVPSA